jgi:hypothetical protein
MVINDWIETATKIGKVVPIPIDRHSANLKTSLIQPLNKVYPLRQ